MRVKFTKPHAAAGQNFKPGNEADLPEDKAHAAIAAGAAEEHKPAAFKNAKGEETMRLRFRRAVSLGGKSCLAGTVDSVPVTDEAWDAVDRGDADLDPPPGVRGQPYPPERLARSEASEAPVPPTPGTIQAVPPRAPAESAPKPTGGMPHAQPKGR